MSFITRFESLASRRRRLLISQVLAQVVLVAMVAFAALAGVDYLLELSWPVRALSFTALGAVSIGYAIRWGHRAWLETSRPATAADVERAFPELGQSIRTTVQYADPAADESRWEGVAPSLIAALVDRTDGATAPMPLATVSRSRTFWLLTAASALLLAAGGFVCLNHWEWRTAARRMLLRDDPYSILDVQPGSMVVDEGQSADIVVDITGRSDQTVRIWTRRTDQPEMDWTEQVLEPSEPALTVTDSRPVHEFKTRLTNLTLPYEYRVTAGALSAGPFPIEIRRPVKIDAIEVELTPPEYTHVKAHLIADGNISALTGSTGRFQFTFDKPVKSASFVQSALHRPLNAADVPERIDLAFEKAREGAGAQRIGQIELTLTEDRQYSIEAEAVDGTRLKPNRFRIRIQHDQPPQVSFSSPRDGIEVHALAELPMRLQVQDDYGLVKAGVVFQINNEQEIPLLAEDFVAVADAAAELAKSGAVSPLTQKKLERVLPLEHFALTQKDSVMYYGYAEDNRPGASQRTVTDMRFIDIRPFKRLYQVYNPDPGNGGMGNGGGLKTLEELIYRQRFGLNRTLQIERRVATGRSPDAGTLDQLIKYETELAGHVHGFALGLESRGFDDTALLYQAEATITAAVDSLSVGKWATATQQMRDALKFLIEQRDRTIERIRKNPDAAFLADLRSFDRMQQQKLRRPKSDKEEARELLARLETLIHQQDEVAQALEPADAAETDAGVAPASEEQK